MRTTRLGGDVVAAICRSSRRASKARGASVPITDPLERLYRLSTVLEEGSTRLAFLNDPWEALGEADIVRPMNIDDPFSVLVETLAEMSSEELAVIGRFGDGVKNVLEPSGLLF